MVGAPLDEVWADATAHGRRSSSVAAKKSKKAPTASCAKSDPLCDLYNRGYSSAFDDIMDSYSSGDMYDKIPYSRTQKSPGEGSDLVSSREPPIRGSDPATGGFSGFEWGGEVGAPFSSVQENHGDHEDHGDHGRHKNHGGRDDVKTTDIGAFTGNSHVSSAPSMAEAKRRAAEADAARQHAFDEEGDTSSDDDEAEPSLISKTRHAAARYANMEEPVIGSKSHDNPTRYAIDVGLYVISGVLLIFLLEQFVQMGTRMRY